MMPAKNNQKQANKKQKREAHCLQWDVPIVNSDGKESAHSLPQETQVRSLGQEDSLEKGMVTHSSILAWRIP